MEPRLKKLDAIAGMPNTLRAFSMPMTSAASDTSRMKGHMIRVRVTVSAALAGSKPGASSATSHGAERIPSTVIALRVTTVSVATLLARRQAAAPSWRVTVRVKTVTNAVERAPSANKSRSRFGMRKAMVNASITRPPPNSAAKICSRARPSTRLQSTARPTTPAALVFSLSARDIVCGCRAGAVVLPSGMRRHGIIRGMAANPSSGRRDPGYLGLTTPVETLPAAYYFDPAQYLRELAQVWYRNWIYVCRSSDVADPRSFRTLGIGDQSIFVVRGEDRVMRAFHNTCRHRGAALCRTAAGRFPAAGIVCPYHAWRYNLRGELLQASSRQPGDGFDSGNYPLYHLPAMEWNGFVFAALTAEPPPFAATLDIPL